MGPLAEVAGKSSRSAKTEALTSSFPELPGVSVSGATVMPDGSPRNVMLTGVIELPPRVTGKDTF